MHFRDKVCIYKITGMHFRDKVCGMKGRCIVLRVPLALSGSILGTLSGKARLLERLCRSAQACLRRQPRI
jgi:hypothetical protein